MPANLEYSTVATGLEKGQFSFQSQRKAMTKNVNYHIIALISQANKVMLKILQTRLQQYVTQELSDIQVGFRKDRGTRGIKFPHLLDLLDQSNVAEAEAPILWPPNAKN